MPLSYCREHFSNTCLSDLNLVVHVTYLYMYLFVKCIIKSCDLPEWLIVINLRHHVSLKPLLCTGHVQNVFKIVLVQKKYNPIANRCDVNHCYGLAFKGYSMSLQTDYLWPFVNCYFFKVSVLSNANHVLTQNYFHP